MTYGQIAANLPGLVSGMGGQFQYGLGQIAPATAFSSVCGALGTVRQADQRPGGGGNTPGAAFQTAWNSLFAAAGCSEPFPGAGTGGSQTDQQDIASILGAINAAMGGGPGQVPAPAPNEVSPGLGGGPGPTPGQPGGGGGGGTIESIINGVTKIIKFGDCELAAWQTLPATTSIADVVRAARASGETRPIGALVTPADGANWGYVSNANSPESSTGATCRVDRRGLPFLCPDRLHDCKPVNAGGNGQQPAGGGEANFGLVGVPPNIISVRRCPGSTRLAKDGLCYEKAFLPAALRENRSKKAPVSWSDAQYIRKGARAAKAIKGWTKRAEKEARKIAPPKRRSPTRRRR